MGLAQSIAEAGDSLREAANSRKCKIGKLLATLDEVDSKALANLLDDPMVKGPKIRQLLNDHGDALLKTITPRSSAAHQEEVRQLADLFKVCLDAVYNHRGHRCSCKRVDS